MRVFHRSDTIYGCRRRADRAYVLGIRGECQSNDEIDGAIVAGDLAALNVQTCSLTNSQSRVLLVSLRTGRVTFATDPLSTAPRIDGGYDAIRGMAVTADGRLAWIGVGVERGVVVAAEARLVQLALDHAQDLRIAHRPAREVDLHARGTDRRACSGDRADRA